MAYNVFHVVRSGLVLSIEIIISILLSLLIVPLGFTLALINEVIRLFISTILWIRHREPHKISLSSEGADNIWAYEKPRNGRICLALLFCTKQIDIVQHRKLYMSRVINHTTKNGRKPYEKLRKILIKKYGYNCHKHDDNFDIQNHVKIWPRAEQSGKSVTDSQLMTEVLPELFKDMDEGKPQWEEVIIPQFEWNNGNHSDPNYATTNSTCSVRIFR